MPNGPHQTRPLLDLLQDLRAADDIESQWQRLCEQLTGLGFDKAVYAFIPCLGDSPTLDEMIWLDAYPEGWLDHYLRNNYFHHDEVVKHCTRRLEPLDWSTLFERAEAGSLPPLTRQLMRDAADFGMLRGISFPVRDGSGAIGGISFGAETTMSEREYKSIIGEHLGLLKGVGEMFHALHDRKTLAQNHYDLNEREIEYLCRLSTGDNNETAAQKMNVSVAMINKHSHNIRVKLNSATLHQAVAKAILLNLIRP